MYSIKTINTVHIFCYRIIKSDIYPQFTGKHTTLPLWN